MKTILPYVNPDLPSSAPAWARTWCGESRPSPLPREEYDAHRHLFRLAESIGKLDFAVDLMTRFPAHALLHASCAKGATCGDPNCGGVGFWFVVKGVSLPASGESDGLVSVCPDPTTCDATAKIHLLVAVSGLVVIGYRRGVTPAVMRAVSEGRTYEEVRAMVERREALN